MIGAIWRGLGIAIRRCSYKGPKIVFTHIPKCGGTAVDHAIARKTGRFGREKIDYEAARRAGLMIAERTITESGLKDDLRYLQYLLCYQLNCGWPLVSGHLPVNREILDEYTPGYRFVTLLRDPAARWKSNYLYNKQLSNHDATVSPSRNYPGAIEDEFAAIVSSVQGFLMGSLASAMLTGIYPDSAARAMELSRAAQANLERFAVVGTLDRMDQFAADLSALLGTPVSIKRENETRTLYGGEEQEEYLRLKAFLERADVHALIDERCRADRALFAFARSLQAS